MSATELLLIDLSGIAHQIWHVSGKEPDPDYVSTQTLARVRSLASQHPHAAVCCDAGRSFRADIDPSYKANRETEGRAPLHHQIRLVEEAAKRDGFVVWKVPGFEADDIIATATVKALAVDNETTVLIATADKDLLQLVSPRVKVKNTGTGPNAGTIADESVVIAKFGVNPVQIHDWLCLVGDASDNVKGAKLIGPKTATELLSKHGSLDAVYAAMDQGVVAGITPNMRTNLMEFRERWPVVSKLIALRYDVEIPFEEIASERTAPPMEDTMPEPFKEGDDSNDAPLPEAWQNESLTALQASAPIAGGTPACQPSIPNGADSGRASKDPVTAVGAVSRLPQSDAGAPVPSAGGSGQYAPVEAPAPAEWELQLEPRSYRDVRIFANDMHGSRKYLRNFGSPQAVIATVVSGRELGVPAMAALRSFHSVEDGPPMPNADLVRGLIIKSGKVEYFEPTERSDEAAEFAIKRHGRPEVRLRYTLNEGRTAYGFDVPMNDAAKADLEKKWQKSGWGKNVADMLVARSSMKLGRLVCPDVCAGLYAPEEMD